MNTCISILASISLGLSIGAGGTAIGNSWWVEHNGSGLNGGEYYMGLWTICTKAAGGDSNCDNTWDKDSITDSPFFLATMAAWTGGLLSIVVAQILWIVYMCRKGHSKGFMCCTIGFAILTFGCWLATVLIWWLRLLKDDDAFLPQRDFLDFAWAYWVAVGATGLSLLAVIFTFIGGCCTGSGTSV